MKHPQDSDEERTGVGGDPIFFFLFSSCFIFSHLSLPFFFFFFLSFWREGRTVERGERRQVERGENQEGGENRNGREERGEKRGEREEKCIEIYICSVRKRIRGEYILQTEREGERERDRERERERERER